MFISRMPNIIKLFVALGLSAGGYLLFLAGAEATGFGPLRIGLDLIFSVFWFAVAALALHIHIISEFNIFISYIEQLEAELAERPKRRQRKAKAPIKIKVKG